MERRLFVKIAEKKDNYEKMNLMKKYSEMLAETPEPNDHCNIMNEHVDRMKEKLNDIYRTKIADFFDLVTKCLEMFAEIVERKDEYEKFYEQFATWEIFVSRMMEENVEAVKHVPQEQVQRITVEQIVDVPVLRIRKEPHEVNQLLIQERISDHVDEHNVHIPSTQFQEQSVQAVRIMSQERIRINRATSAVLIQTLDHNTDAPWHNERVVDVREETNLHFDSYQRDATDGVRSRWKHLADVAPIGLQHNSSVKRQQH